MTNEEFCVIWQTSATLAEAAERWGRSRHATSRRAMWFRDRGVRLKRMYDGDRMANARIDVAALNAVIDAVSHNCKP